MAAESSRDLPPELLEKLRDLELELEDGDITQKGFEKKRTNLLEQYSAPEPSKTSSSGSVISQREDEDYDYGPEPSAADVVDFLDYLPSPTHSPTRSSRGAGYMEENFQQQQLERAASESSASYNNSNNNNYPRTHPSPTIPYRPYTQTSQPLQSLQQQPLQQQQIHYGQPIRQVEAPMGHPAQGPYYHPSAPGRPYDPRMAPRPSFPQNAGPPSPMRHSPNPYGYQPQPQTQQQQRPQPSPPSGGGYRPAPITHGGAYPPRPMYNTPRPTTGQQRPMYRPVPMNRPNGNYYRPTGHPNGANGAYQDNRQDPNMMYANPRSNYPYNGRPPVHGRQNSEFTTDSSDASMRQSYGRNDQSVEWDNSYPKSESGHISSGRAPSIISVSNRSIQPRFTNNTVVDPRLTLLQRSHQLSKVRSRYGNTMMATTFKAIESIPAPTVSLDEQFLLADLAGRQDPPLVPRDVPLDPDNIDYVELTQCENLAQVLRYRVANNSLSRAMPAFTTVDSKGKETTSLTWEKLLARAEKVAKVIREKSDLKLGDRVALIYRKSEAIEFTIALFGCFLSGRVAVPINAADELAELAFVLNLSATRLVLTTEHNLKAFTKDMQARQVDFPKNIEWWKTNDFGSWYPSQKSSGYPDLKVPELAYIEYVKAANGELKGVAITHKTLMAQCRVYKAATTETCAAVNEQGEMVIERMAGPQPVDVVVSYLEPRQQVGLVLSILCSVFSGNHTIFASASIMETPAIWVYVLSKYSATIALADYPGLKLATKLYQAHPKEVQFVSKKVVPNLSELRLLMIDTIIVQPEVNEFIAEELLRPLGNTEDPLEVVCPVASLPEHGGMLLSFRDYLGPAVLEEWSEEPLDSENNQDQEQDQDYQPSSTRKMTSTLASGHSRDVWECVLDADALRLNKVVVLAAGSPDQISEHFNQPGQVRMGSFGFVIPQATVAIVDPETTAICAADTIGEVWIDAPSVPGGFWGLPKHSSAIFHARPIIVQPDTLHPEIYDQEFLRTGLVGKLIGGRLVVFGTYEERIRQQRLGEGLGLTEVHFASSLVETITKNTRLDSCVFFDITLNSQNLPVLAFESAATREELPGLINSVVDLALGYHGLRLYAAVVVGPNNLPRSMKNGRRYLHAMMTKRAFLAGQMNLRYLKMDVDRTVFGVATSDDPNLDIWRSYVAYEKGVSMGIISARPQPQHTGMEIIRSVLDERTDFDLSKFTNIIDLFIWRTSLHPEETAFTVLTQSNGSLPTKSYTWRKMSTKIATVANFLQKKLGLKRNQKVLLFIPFGIDFIISIYACLSLGIIVVTCPPPDPDQHPQRIQDDVGSMFAALHDLSISYILTNTRAEDILKNKQVSPVVKQVLAQYRKANFKMPEQSSVSKAPKFNKLLGKESGFMVQPEWLSDKSPALISVQYSADMRRVYATLGHDTILAQCRTQKMTCQMKFQRSLVVASIYGTFGLGLLHSAFCGVYVGCPTVTISDEDFYTNPLAYFELIQRYKAKDVCVSHPLLQYAMNRISQSDLRRVVLHNVQNMMVTTDDRPKPVLYQHITRYLAITRLEKEAINTVYSHASNPMVTTRSYMLVEPISLFVDFAWLRQGIVRPLSPEEDTSGVLLHDSGIVPSNTMIAIVNPETQMLCPSNVIGEIWVASDCNIQTLYGLNEASHAARFEATISGADPRVKYMRTGDLGFLWNVQRQTGTQQTVVEEGQCLFVLGAISETIEVNRLLHFPIDIENTIERSHPGIPVGGCHVFQAGSEVVVVAAIKAKEQALAAIPMIVNTVLEGHSFLVDTVVIVNSNQLPRSRYGDKLRGKTLASFVEKKLSAMCMSRITNQHQPLTLPQWSNSQANLDNDTGSIMSGRMSYMGGNSFIDNHEQSERRSLDPLRRTGTASSHHTQSSAGADSIPATVA